MKLSTKHLLLGLVLVVALSFFYFKTNRIDSAQHDRFIQNLRGLKQLDVALNEGVLKSRLHLLQDYDQFPKLVQELRDTLRELGAIPSFISESERKRIVELTADLANLVTEKERAQERFKSQNAALNGSLHYLPITGVELIRLSANDRDGMELRAILNQVMRQVLMYGIDSHGEHLAETLSSLKDLEAWSGAHPEHSQNAELASLNRHARSILQRKPKVEEITRRIVSVPLGSRSEELLSYYEERFSVAMRNAGGYRLGLYLLCALLAFGIGYTMVALDKANTRLESRVLERTRDLSTKNDQLHAEITERQRAETQLVESEQRLRLILESEPECVKIVAADGTLLEINPAGLKMVEARTASEVVGRQVDRLIAPEYRAEYGKLHQAIFRGESRILEFEIVGLKGTRRWMETHACPLRNAGGEITAHLAVTRDITQRKQSQAELAYERDLLRTLLDNCPDQIYFKDRESRFLKCSSALAERFQRSASQLVGRRECDYFGAVQTASRFADEQRIIATGEPLIGKIEKELSRQNNGEMRWVLTTKLPLKDKSGEIIGTFGISKDITPMKEAEARLEQVHQQLVETSRQAGMAEVATNVLHNVGNVLNSVNISCSVLSTAIRKSSIDKITKTAELLREHEAGLGAFFASNPVGQKLPNYLQRLSERLVKEQERTLQELEVLSENIVHIKEIVAMQQNYSKVSGLREMVNPADLLEESLRLNADSLTRHQVQPVREYEATPPILVEKHKAQMILVNLIRNAKYACQESDRPDKQIWLRVSRGEENIRISVADNGVGIPAENLIRIFHHGFTTRKDGHGFGLHSAVLTARELGGNLLVHSDGIGCGATFTLELPIKANIASSDATADATAVAA